MTIADGDLLSRSRLPLAQPTTAARSRSTTTARVADATDDFIEYSPAARLRRRPRPSPTRSTDGNGEYRHSDRHCDRHEFERSSPVAQDDGFTVAEDSINNVLAVKLDNGNGDQTRDRRRRPAVRYRRRRHADNGGSVSINDNGTGGRCTTDDFIEYSPAARLLRDRDLHLHDRRTATAVPTRRPSR